MRSEPIRHWQPISYPSWQQRERYVATITRWHLETCLKLGLKGGREVE